MTFRAPESDARECEQITLVHARTFSLASKLLPAEKRRAAYALYAFCRVADDLVDRADSTNTQLLADQLDAYRNELRAALEGKPSSPIFREIAWVARAYQVSPAPLFELLDGVGRDLVVTTYDTWTELEHYCQGVASSVGEMCTYVFGVPAGPSMRAHAIQYARTLGTAMQLTNILRDVGEDAQRGRCYLPAEDLARFGLTACDVLTNRAVYSAPGWRPMMQYEVGRARALYAAAMPGIALLDPDAQRCAAACASGYAAILTAIEAQQYDTISTRARLGNLARAGILWNAWRYRAETPDLSTLGRGPRIVWEPAPHGASDRLVPTA
ncbi:MAG: phytoene/squalene synthase family protein [Gemmatimonadaceae bacterium]|nr:phytoene/squalene synthase family protein [Gemmatimonadaceae bacterium]